MDVNGHYEQRMQHYESLLREAEEYRLARELGFTEADTPRSLAARLWGWLSQRPALRPSGSDNALIRRTRYGG